MLKSKKLKIVLGMGAILVPTIVFGKTSATVNVEVLDIKTSPNAEEVVTQMYKGDTVEVLKIVQGEDSQEAWYEIATQENGSAFVEQGNLVITDTEGVANTNNLNIRSYPDVNNSQVIGKLQSGDEVRLLYKVGKFYKVYVNDMSGFVYADYIDTTYGQYMQEQDIESVKDIVTGKTRSEEEASTKASVGDKIVSTAMQYLGNPYVYGGTSLTNGTDCSGFTQGVTKLVGISIPRTSKAQSTTGTLVSKSQMQKGDLLFFGDSPSSIFHTGIYIGDGKMIHASTSKSGIIIADAYSGGGAPLQVIRRVY